MPGWDEELRNYLFKEGPIAHHGEHDHDDDHGNDPDSLKIGKLKK